MPKAGPQTSSQGLLADCAKVIGVIRDATVYVSRRSALELLAAPALLGSLAFPLRAGAEPYPTKPIRIIVPYPAGGPYDGIPRIIAHWISAQLGWPIVMDNRTGATGLIGLMAAKQAAADGHTLVVVTTSTHGSMPALKRNLAYDAVRDFAPIVLLADATLVLLVRDDLPVQSVAQLIAMMRDRPGRLNYSTGGYGSPHHLATITLFQRAGLAARRRCACAVRRACARPDGVARRQRPIHDHQHRRGHATYRQRQAAASCDHQPQALASSPGRADHGGARLSRLRGGCLVRFGGCCRNA